MEFLSSPQILFVPPVRRMPAEILFPRKFYWEERAASRATLALAIAIALVSEFQTTALGILPKAIDQPPGAIGAAVGPTGTGSPYRFGSLAAWEWQL